MSFILDALKKSENERQRTVGPSLADAPMRRARPDRPWWAVAVAALLFINLGVLIVVLMRDKPAENPATAAAAVAAQVASSTPAPAGSEGQPAMMSAQPVLPSENVARLPSSPAVRSLADEAGAPVIGTASNSYDPPMHPGLAAASAAPAGPSMVRPIQPPTVTALPADPAARSGVGSSDARDNEVLPTAGDLAAGGTTLPDLKLDIHVFSKNPAERFVFINMRKYQEGQSLQEGPVLERITSDGVVLNQHGLRYALPRQ